MPSKKTTSAAKLAMKIPAAIGDEAISSITTTAPTAAPVPPDVDVLGADAVLQGAMEAAQPGQEPELPPPAGDEPIPGLDPAQNPEPEVVRADLATGSDFNAHWTLNADGSFVAVAGPHPPILELADARALRDVAGTNLVYRLATFDSPLAIRAFKDHDGRTMVVVDTGLTLAKAAIND